MNITERSFIILKNANKVPSLAACSNCQRKFFTPTEYQSDREGAEQYLRGKFDQHNCDEDIPKRRQW